MITHPRSIILIFSLSTSMTLAAPVVLLDNGATRDSKPGFLTPKTPPSPIEQQQSRVRQAFSGQYLLEHLFPVHTPEMRPGRLTPRDIDYPQLPAPVFLIGSDDYSRRWLAYYKNRLAAVGAMGYLVEVETFEQYQAMKSLAGNLMLLPASGSQLAQALSLNHYPVLISSHRIEQ